MNFRQISRLAFAGVIILSLAISVMAGPGGQGKRGGRHHDKAAIMRQLNLTQDQQARINNIKEQAKADAQRIRNSNLTQDQKRTQLRELHQRTKNSIMSVLTPQQRQQLERMHDQRMKKGNKGQSCIARLNLTPQQRERATAIRRETRERVTNVRSDNTLTQAQKQERIASILRVADRDFREILTPAQQRQLDACRQSGRGSMQKQRNR